jgi:hypothetical protein
MRGGTSYRHPVMKKSTVLLPCIPMLAGFLHATPDHAVEVREAFFGSNASGFVVRHSFPEQVSSERFEERIPLEE